MSSSFVNATCVREVEGWMIYSMDLECKCMGISYDVIVFEIEVISSPGCMSEGQQARGHTSYVAACSVQQ